jgi:hypothetical protein
LVLPKFDFFPRLLSQYCHKRFFVCGYAVSFQITILKVLAGHPEGRASLADLRRAVAILISSGSDWTNRTKRLAARALGLDIFGQALVFYAMIPAGRSLMPVERYLRPSKRRSPRRPRSNKRSNPL